MSRGVFAYICKACNHYISGHRYTERSGGIDFYRCVCGCRITIDAPTWELKMAAIRAGYDATRHEPKP